MYTHMYIYTYISNNKEERKKSLSQYALKEEKRGKIAKNTGNFYFHNMNQEKGRREVLVV